VHVLVFINYSLMRFFHKHIKYTIIHLHNAISNKHNITNNNGNKNLIKFMEAPKSEIKICKGHV